MQSGLRERLAHLLRRAGLSAHPSEVERLLPLGIEGAVDYLLDYENRDDPIDDAEVLAFLQGESPRLQPPMVASWWLYRMLVTRRPLQERMAFFWHNHFATSAGKVGDGRLMLMQIQMFQRLALADFKTLVLEVSKDPAMLVWLDGVRNVKGKPNENFARELMELFTMGIGNYTERDIQEAARAFTGWTYSRVTGSFVFNRNQHDDGEKEVLGKRGQFRGDDIVEMVVEHPATARHMARKFYTHFINDVDPLDERAIQELARTFTESGYSVRALMRRLLLSQAFWSNANYRRRIKSPVEFVVGLLRQLGVGERLRETMLNRGAGQRLVINHLRLASQWTRRIGQSLLYPPDVAGWEWGTAWISSTTMLERMKFSEFLLPERGVLGIRTLQELIGGSVSTTEQLIERLEQVLDTKLDRSTRAKLKDYLEANGGIAVLNSRRREVVLGALQIVLASPEFQMM